MSCVSDVNLKGDNHRWDYGERPVYAWTDVTWLLDKDHVSWRTYVGNSTCWRQATCQAPEGRTYETTSNRNVLPGFTSFSDGERANGVADNIRPVNDYLASAADGSLPSVAWIFPTAATSEHPNSPSTTRTGMAYVTRLDQRGDAGPRLGLDRDLPHLGRLGRVLRPRHAATDRRQRLRLAGSSARDQPVGAGRRDRPHGALIRFVPASDRGPVHRRPAAQPQDRRAPRLATDGARRGREPDQQGVRLQPAAAAAAGLGPWPWQQPEPWSSFGTPTSQSSSPTPSPTPSP